MANDLNLCQFIGRLGNDPDIKYTNDGKPVANISIACGEQWKDKSGQKQEKTEWVRVVFFGKVAEIVGEYLRKGSQVYVAGKIATRKWQDKEGSDRYTTEIVGKDMQMLGGKAGGASYPSPSQPGGAEPAQAPESFVDDDLPF